MKRFLRAIFSALACLLLFSLYPQWVTAQDEAATEEPLIEPVPSDGFDLPTEFYVLTNEGQIDRYGLGADGIRTVTPEEAFVIDFGVAPDGEWLAYRTETALLLRNVTTEAEQTLDDTAASVPSLRGQGKTIAWAPNGNAVAITALEGGRVYFSVDNTPLSSGAEVITQDLLEGAFYQFVWSPTGRFLAGEVADNVWWIYRREGTSLVLSSAILSSQGLAWASSFEAVFAPAEGGLLIMNMDAANAQTVLLDESWTYNLPVLAEDGFLKFFGRQQADPLITEGYGRLLGLRSGIAETSNLSDVAIELGGMQWAPEGRLLVALRDGTLSLVNPAEGTVFPLPIENAVAYDWGPLRSAAP